MEIQQVTDGLEALSSLRGKINRLEEFFLVDTGKSALSLEELIEWAAKRIDHLTSENISLSEKKRRAEGMIERTINFDKKIEALEKRLNHCIDQALFGEKSVEVEQRKTINELTNRVAELEQCGQGYSDVLAGIHNKIREAINVPSVATTKELFDIFHQRFIDQRCSIQDLKGKLLRVREIAE